MSATVKEVCDILALQHSDEIDRSAASARQEYAVQLEALQNASNVKELVAAYKGLGFKDEGVGIAHRFVLGGCRVFFWHEDDVPLAKHLLVQSLLSDETVATLVDAQDMKGYDQWQQELLIMAKHGGTMRGFAGVVEKAEFDIMQSRKLKIEGDVFGPASFGVSQPVTSIHLEMGIFWLVLSDKEGDVERNIKKASWLLFQISAFFAE